MPDLCEFWYAPWTNRLHRVDSDDSVSSRRYLEETQQCAMERVCRCMQNIAPLSMVQFVYTSLSSATSCPRGWLYARYASRFEQRIGMLIKGDHSEKYATVRQSKHLCVGSSLPCQTCAAFPSVFNAVSWLVRLQRRVLASPGANWERRRCKEHLLKIYSSFAGAISKTSHWWGTELTNSALSDFS